MNNKNFKKQEATKLARLFDKGYKRNRNRLSSFGKTG